MSNTTTVKTRKSNKKQNVNIETLENALANVQAVNTEKKATDVLNSSIKETKKAFDVFSLARTKDTIKSNVEKLNSQATSKTKSNTDNVRLSSFKTKNDVINSTFIIETACNIASRTLKRVTVQQIAVFIETVCQFTKFHYARETSNVTRVRNHIKATCKKDLYDYDVETQSIVFKDSFIEENRKNKTHIEQTDKDLVFIQEQAVHMKHSLIK